MRPARDRPPPRRGGAFYSGFVIPGAGAPGYGPPPPPGRTRRPLNGQSGKLFPACSLKVATAAGSQLLATTGNVLSVMNRRWLESGDSCSPNEYRAPRRPDKRSDTKEQHDADPATTTNGPPLSAA